MYFESFADFIAMGRHGFYVWLAYGIALAIFVFNIVHPMLQRKKIIADLKRRERREQQKRT